VDGAIVTGRAAVLIRWLAQQQRKINQPEKGCLQIDFARDRLTKRLTEIIEN